MYNLDLRFVVPALINLTLFLLQQHQSKPWNGYEPNSNLNLSLNLDIYGFFSVLILVLVFLITSVKLPLSVTAEPIRVRTGDFSCLLAISLIASVVLPQLLFWFGFVIIICLSPWHGFLSDLSVGLLFRTWDILRGIPALIITCFVQKPQQDDPPPPPPQVEVVVADDVGGNPILLE
ncbi:hypothetical protein Vadar_023442 [Vaccinium darrowii]|uniref:Uncharacterized protein n=1 Tax=Vaccinium darrowii TaxID=229202 RepID=A0ACB7XSK0_9ERIC|nr:hypothetical protein Vadar_023442 [Vaccinium darrowii]